MTDQCLVCGIYKPEHDKAEFLRTVNHRFSNDGALEALPKPPPGKKSPSRPQIMVVGAVDVALRQLLVDKGILTHEDLATLLDPGTGTAGNPEDRETESSS